MEEIARAIAKGETTVTIGDKDMTLLEAAKHLASQSLEHMTDDRLRKALMVAAAIADYAQIDLQ